MFYTSPCVRQVALPRAFLLGFGIGCGVMAQNKQTVYHGTSFEAAANIRKEQHFRESEKDNEWLGSGIYFFRYKGHAQRWIKNRGLEPGDVLTATLEYDDRELLDLDDPDQREAVNREMIPLIQKMRRSDGIMPSKRYGKWVHWCLVCNLYRRLHPEIGIIIYTFPQAKKPGASWFPNNERQICVSKHEIITRIT